ncbi:catalase [Polymorphospora rubra]
MAQAAVPLFQDHHLREKITHFDHERIPERVGHLGQFRQRGGQSNRHIRHGCSRRCGPQR